MVFVVDDSVLGNGAYGVFDLGVFVRSSGWHSIVLLLYMGIKGNFCDTRLQVFGSLNLSSWFTTCRGIRLSHVPSAWLM